MNEILTIEYDRMIESTTIVLTPDNCTQYGYTSMIITIDDKDYTVYYKSDDTYKEIAQYTIEDGEAITEVLWERTEHYTHIAPPCSDYKISFADVDKEGSGRNSETGEMFRERIGKYLQLEVAWALIPNSKKYNNWYKVLTYLPSKIKLKYLSPEGKIKEGNFYRGEISTDLYLFVKNHQIWQGLSTTFIQWDVTEYNETTEPIYEDEEE